MRNQRRYTERKFQIKLAGILDNLNLVWCHVPNGGFRDVREAVLFKYMGVKSGVPDILIFTLSPILHKPCFIELKAEGGNTSKNQRTWAELLRHCGWEGHLCKKPLESIDALKRWGYL